MGVEIETEIVRGKRGARERPISFTKMDDMKNRWETTSQQGRRESQREARKEEIAGIRSRLFMVKLFNNSFNSSAKKQSLYISKSRKQKYYSYVSTLKLPFNSILMIDQLE